MVVDKKEVLKKFRPTIIALTILGDFNVCGSIGLFLSGIIDRMPSDIDICVDDYEAWVDHCSTLFEIDFLGYEEEREHFQFSIKGVKVDVFGVDKLDYDKIDGIRVSKPNFSIEAKESYLLNNFTKEKFDKMSDKQKFSHIKHLFDIRSYYEWLAKNKSL